MRRNAPRSIIIVLAALMLVALPLLASGQQTLVLEIKGMYCSGCASGIKAMLERVDGVSKADVSFEQHVASVVYDPTKTNAAKLIETVEKMGYKAAPEK